MKFFKIFAVLLLFGTAVYAESSIDEQIAAIEAASGEKRVELVNEFKTTLLTLSDEERASAINQLRSSMSSNAKDKHEMVKSQMEGVNRAHMSQMDVMKDMQISQQIDQQQAAAQAMREGVIGAIHNSGIENMPGTGPGSFMGR